MTHKIIWTEATVKDDGKPETPNLKKLEDGKKL